ncbi:MAG TPA: hypothetical protein VKM55_28980 [Candidatus Lokiarchaeia archaeon]|nr:hypothetical protein [Candidatus Lokiarchaeia archaeon]
MTISEKEALVAFKTSVLGKFPGASFVNVAVKRFSSNNRILIPVESTTADNQKNRVVKFKSILVASIPKKKFEPIMIYTKSKQVMACARLTTHGGHIAVEIARKIARQQGTKLVILGDNVLCFIILDVQSMDAIASFFNAAIEKLLVANDAFHARINQLIA